MKNNAAIVIPARLASTRVPNKMLYNLHGISAIRHVIRRLKKGRHNLEIIVTTPDEEICKIAEDENVRHIVTSVDHETGTQRCIEAVKYIDVSHLIIVQGDEVLVDPNIIERVYADILDDTSNDAWNVIAPVSESDLHDLSVVKCHVEKQYIIECSRERINGAKNQYQLQGIFAFKKSFLLNEYPKLKGRRSQNESIEQLLLIENSKYIKALTIDQQIRSLNTFQDIPFILKELEKEKT